ncbi:MAG TPA: hypothetical protein VE912_02320, partial [Bacteroidales bacterium]|nr:hypothetical protein [Bacteroidales bacterium]
YLSCHRCSERIETRIQVTIVIITLHVCISCYHVFAAMYLCPKPKTIAFFPFRDDTPAPVIHPASPAHPSYPAITLL